MRRSCSQENIYMDTGGRVQQDKSKQPHREEWAKPTPHIKNQRRAKQPRREKQQEPKLTRPRNTTRTRRDQTPDTQGQIEQVEANNRPKDGPSTPPGKRQRKRRTPKRQKAYQTIAEKGGQVHLSSLRACTQACTEV